MATAAIGKQVRWTFVVEKQRVRGPEWVTDLESFLRWADTDEFPETGRICYLDGEVWVDMSKEQFFSHGQVKHQYALVIGMLVQTGDRGFYLPDGTRFSNTDADIGVVADGGFVSSKSLRSGRARLIEGAEGGYVEVEGSPDMLLEVVSDSSVWKDTDFLLQAYWQCGIREYWLVDARKEPLRFEIFRHKARGYVAAPKKGGWVKSVVLGKAFKLTRKTGADGLPRYRLAVR